MTEHRGVIDRIVDGTATVIVEEDGEPVDEVHLDAGSLPDGADEGSIVVLRRRVIWEIVSTEESSSRQRRAEIEGRMDHLRRERGGGRFGRDKA